jgi:hypothetical protein
MNTNEEQTKEEVVVIGAEQLEKEIEKVKTICIKLVEKEINKPNKVGESQISLVTTIAVSGVGKEWEDIVDRFLVAIKTTQDQKIQQ